jgi:hypothetical protein
MNQGNYNPSGLLDCTYRPECISDAASTLEHGTYPPQANPCDSLEADADVIGRADSATMHTSRVSLPGIVDAILEVSRQRKILLDQMRSALILGDDTEALRFARQLCGIGLRFRRSEP